MKRKLLSLTLALAAVLSCLSACSAPETDRFYDMVEEMTALEDVNLTLTIPYHGASMVVEGFLCRSSQTADLTFTLEGTGETDGVWTELRIDGNDLWLNVDQMVERTEAFELVDVRQQDMEDFAYGQTADWVNYQWQGDLWAGMPDLAELLHDLWDGTREDLSPHITGSDGNYTLDLSEDALQTALEHVAERLVEDSDAWQTAILAAISDQNDLVLASTWDPAMLMGSVWSGWSEWLESGETVDSTLTLTLSRTEEGYQAGLTLDGETWSLTLTPAEAQTVETPEVYMDFGAYDDWLYYLTTFSWQYIGEAYDGTQMEEADAVVDEAPAQLMPMTTREAAGYTGISTIQFIPEEGVAETLPVLNGYTSNEVSSVSDDGVEITQLTLSGPGWTQSFYTETAGENAAYIASEAISGYYSAFIDTSGYLLVQDISEISYSTDGASAAQGFSYRQDDYSDPEGRIVIAYRPSDCETYTVIELELRLAEMSEESKSAVRELFDFLHLELPISLDA